MRSERGFALIAALWFLVGLSAVGLELSLAAKSRRLTALNLAEGAQAEWAARAGLETARTRLNRLTGDDPWWNAQAFMPDTVRIGEAAFTVSVRDAGAGLHLNRATEEELRTLFEALRLDAGDADRLAQAIADWRDADDLHRPRGAEADAYREAGAPVLPRNGPFRSVGELRHVRGVTPEIYETVARYLTVLGTGRVNINSVPRPVLRALPGITDEAVAAIERRRAAGGRFTNVQQLMDALSPQARDRLRPRLPELIARTTFATMELEVTATGWVGDGRVRARASALAFHILDQASLIGVRIE